jgi:NDP-sugar pyrophosphorylase family protein
MVDLRGPHFIPFAAGIIAAGDGMRLKAAYPDTIKPLLPILGTPLIQWTVSSLISSGAQEIVILLNSHGRKAREHLQRQEYPVPLKFLEADTRSSWESFRLVSKKLAEDYDRFLISTVDALIPSNEIARFAQAALKVPSPGEPAAALALTRFVEDEKPLWADVTEAGRVTALGQQCLQRQLVTCGLYALNRQLTQALGTPEAFESLREFWAAVLKDGVPVLGVSLAKTVDVDRPEDVATAEEFVSLMGARS